MIGNLFRTPSLPAVSLQELKERGRRLPPGDMGECRIERQGLVSHRMKKPAQHNSWDDDTYLSVDTRANQIEGRMKTLP